MMKISLLSGAILSLSTDNAHAWVPALTGVARCRQKAVLVAQPAVPGGRRATSNFGRTAALTMDTTVIQADFKLPIAIGAAGLLCTKLGNPTLGFPLSVAGVLLAFQATRVAFEFDDEAMEVKLGNAMDGQLEESGENAFVGGKSRWKYNTWTNWEVYPNESFPVLMYFKETQTKPEGQIHFFPFIMNPEDLLREVRARVPQVVK